MKIFYRKIRSFLPILLSIALLPSIFFFFSGFCSGNKIGGVDFAISSLAVDDKIPQIPSADKNGERERILKDAIPGSPVPVQRFRRSDENPVRNFFRDGDAAVFESGIALLTMDFLLFQQKQNHSFVFQKILRHSLPPRASPLKA